MLPTKSFVLAAWLLPAIAICAGAVTIPVGAEIQLRLTTAVSSAKPSGQPVSAVAIAPVLVNGTAAIPLGAKLEGVTADAHANQPAANGNAEQPATVRIQLTKISDGHGQSKPITCALEGVDNAREAVDQSGLITGITASRTFTSLADQGIDKVTAKYGDFGGMLANVKKAIVKPADPAIDYQPGVEFTVKLAQPLDWNPSPDPHPVSAITPLDKLQAFVAQQPFRTAALKPPSPSDLTNLMFIGSKDQIETAFKDAGWFVATLPGRASNFRTAQAIIENRGYDEAPMSILTLDGKEADMTYEKQNNTFESRHHIRLWQAAQPFDGKPVFIGAATHDVKIYFSQTSRSITHGIDPNIDKERTKVLNDMIFTGKVQAAALVDRNNIPKDISNATGDKLQTDDKLQVIEFKN